MGSQPTECRAGVSISLSSLNQTFRRFARTGNNSLFVLVFKLENIVIFFIKMKFMLTNVGFILNELINIFNFLSFNSECGMYLQVQKFFGDLDHF